MEKEITEEEKYRRKAAMLKRALAAADEADKKDEAKAASAKAKEKVAKAKKREQKAQESEVAKKQAEKDASPVLG